jgi:hypothetical protein
MSIGDGSRAFALAGVALLAASSFACSFSHSSKSISDSIASSSKSVSNSVSSSSPESDESKYQKDVESYTQAFVTSGGSDTAFMGGVSDLASKRGITDWESDEHTWIGIGRGLGRTKIDDVQLGVYQKNWTGGDPAKIKLIQQGFDEVR